MKSVFKRDDWFAFCFAFAAPSESICVITISRFRLRLLFSLRLVRHLARASSVKSLADLGRVKLDLLYFLLLEFKCAGLEIAVMHCKSLILQHIPDFGTLAENLGFLNLYFLSLKENFLTLKVFIKYLHFMFAFFGTNDSFSLLKTRCQPQGLI